MYVKINFDDKQTQMDVELILYNNGKEETE